MPNECKYKVVDLVATLEDLDEERKILGKIGCEVIQGGGKTSEEIIETARDAHALIGSGEPMTKKVFDSLDRLRVVALIGVGFESVDIKAATEHGVLVTHVPDLIIDPVADHTLALILSLVRRVPQADRMLRKGIWGQRMSSWAKPVPRLRGSTAGIVGFGRIGKAVATRLKAFGVSVKAWNPHSRPLGYYEPFGVTPVSDLAKLLKESDIVTVTLPLSKETTHLISEEQFKTMKKSAFIVNTSRGAIIDERALCEALSQGWIAGAALDVMETEPLNQDNPLLELENLILTPHIAYYSDESVLDQRRRTAEEVSRALQGLSPLYPINPEVLTQTRERY